MSQGPRHINTDRSLNRPTEQRPTEASALHQVSLSGQPDFFQNEQPEPRQPELPRQSAGGVRIMSIHKSKGLEFPIVFLCDLSKRFDPRDVQEPVLVHPELGLSLIHI